MNKNIIVAGIGEILWDIFPTGRKVGGAPMNFAFHCSQLGASGIAISELGDDELGYTIYNIMKQNKLDTNYISKNTKYPTGTVQVSLDNNGKPEYEICENVAWDFIEISQKHIDISKKLYACCT